LRPDYWDGYNSLGLFYDDHGKYDDAIAQLQHAIQLTPDNAQAYSNLGAAYLDSGDPKKAPLAEAALKKSIELSPSYPAYANLGFLYHARHDYADAAAVTEKALALNDKDFMVWANLAAAYESMGDLNKAAAARDREQPLLEQALEKSPRDAAAHARLGLLYAHKKLRERALSQIRTSLALAPEDSDVLQNVGETYEILGDRKPAIEYIEKALQKGYSFEAVKSDPYLKDLLSDPNFRPSSK